MHNMISAKHRRDTTMVALLFSIVLIFLLCHSIRLGLNIYEAFQVCNALKVGLIFVREPSRCWPMGPSRTGAGGRTASRGGTIWWYWKSWNIFGIFFIMKYFSSSSSTPPVISSSTWLKYIYFKKPSVCDYCIQPVIISHLLTTSLTLTRLMSISSFHFIKLLTSVWLMISIK